MNTGLHPIFRPQSVAVVGASTQVNSLGHQILQNLIQYRFPGKIYPVNPRVNELLGLRCFPSVLDIPEQVDLAVIVVPRELSLAAVEHCGSKGVSTRIGRVIPAPRSSRASSSEATPKPHGSSDSSARATSVAPSP